MLIRVVLQSTVLSTVWILALVLPVEVRAEIVNREFSGRLSVGSRWHPQAAAHSDQRSHASGFVAELKLYLEDIEGRSLTLAPLFRYDAGDPHRTHADLREAYLLLFGEIGNDEWELRLGVDRVFWGVTESRHLVNIINQIDLVEHPYKEPKLGQPMAHLTWSGDWGVAEIFGLTYHRARTFPSSFGRLRFPLVVDTEQISYESDAGKWHLDLAARYSHSLGPLDIGLSVFDGASREPLLLPSRDRSGALVFAPHYEQIRQFGLDTQLTIGSWLFKLEAIQRSGTRNRLGLEEDYVATAFGGEYTFYSVWGSTTDISLLGEWTYDGRDRNATNIFQNDLFFGTRVSFNDPQSTEILASFLKDLDMTSRVMAVELNRRISEQWFLHLEVIALLGIDRAALDYELRRDSFIELNLIYNF